MIAIDSVTAMEFLTGIANHARAGNFDQAILQAQSVIEAMAEAIRLDLPGAEAYNQALPLVREIPQLAARSDKGRIIDDIHEAIIILRTAEG